MSKQVTNNSGISFLSLLTIVFITLKLTNFITWSWWLVLAPTWAPITLGVVLIGIAFALKSK